MIRYEYLFDAMHRSFIYDHVNKELLMIKDNTSGLPTRRVNCNVDIFDKEVPDKAVWCVERSDIQRILGKSVQCVWQKRYKQVSLVYNKLLNTKSGVPVYSLTSDICLQKAIKGFIDNELGSFVSEISPKLCKKDLEILTNTYQADKYLGYLRYSSIYIKYINMARDDIFYLELLKSYKDKFIFKLNENISYKEIYEYINCHKNDIVSSNYRGTGAPVITDIRLRYSSKELIIKYDIKDV